MADVDQARPGWGKAPAVVAGAVAGWLLCAAVAPISRDASHLGRMELALAGVGFVGAWVWLHRAQAARWMWQTWRASLALICVVSVFNYFQFDRRVFEGIGDHTDIAYYYLNSKYLEELSYDGLYAAMLQSDRERGGHRTAHITQVRDLTDYEVRPVRHALRRGRQLRDQKFTAARWEQFGDDAAYFLGQLPRNMLRSNFFVDHGYNPPPTWSLVGGTVAEWVGVEHLHWISQLDTLWVVAMFAAVAWAFGPDVMLFGLLWWCCTFSGRWPILGQSLMRFDWVAALVIGVCFLKQHRVGVAGAALAFAGLNRVFPLVFLAPTALTTAWHWWKEGRLLPRHRRFWVAAGLMAALLLGGSFLRFGPLTFGASAQNLWMHNQTYSSHRVGLGDLVVYRGETTRAQINAGGGIAVKEREIQRLQPGLRVAGLISLCLVGGAVAWGRREEWEQVGWAALPLFCMTNAQINYWNLRLVLVLWHAWHLRKAPRPWHVAGLVWLFVVEMITQATKVAALDRYTTTTTTSLLMAVYLAGLVVWMVRAVREDGRLAT